MTHTKSMGISATDRTRQLHLAQLLRGPAQKVLTYAFSFAYTQKCDVLSYLGKHDLKFHFTDAQLQLLSKVRNPNLYTIPVLYKIFKYCCENKLQDEYSRDWDVCSHGDYTSGSSLEMHIALLHHKYQEITSNNAGDVNSLEQVILGTVQRVGEQLGVRKWKQQHESIKSSIKDILEEVHPAMDVKERVNNAAGVEISIRNECLKEAVQENREKALKNSPFEPEDAAELLNLPFCITSVPPEHCSSEQERADEEKRVEANNILAVLQQKCQENVDGKKICCLSGDFAAGKSSLASNFVLQHMQGDSKIKHLDEYEIVLAISSKEIQKTDITKWIGPTKSQRNDLNNFIDDFWSISEAFLPRTCAKYGVKHVGQMLTSRKILFIIDDADELSDSKVKEVVLFLGQILFDSAALIFGSGSAISKIKFCFISFSSVQHFHLHGIYRKYLLEKSGQFKESMKIGKKRITKSFKDSFKSNMNRIGHIIEYPNIYQEILHLWKHKSSLVRETFTATELLWNLSIWRAEVALGADLKKDILRRKKLFRWFSVVGEMALYCIKANIKLNEASHQEIEESATKLFGCEEGVKLSEAFFLPHFVFYCDTFTSIPTSTTRSLLEFFSSYYIIQKLVSPEHVNVLDFLPTTNAESLIAYIIGHLRRWDSGEIGDETPTELSFELMTKIIESLVNYERGKNEDIEFLCKIATEFRSSHKLLQLMVNVTDYAEEWDLNFSDIHQKTLENMMQHVAPVRIILRADRPELNYELMPVLKFLGRVPISVWFESKEQFQHGSYKSMDKLLRPMLSEGVVCRIDLFSGSLSQITMMDMLDYKCMSHLVMLALRVTDEEALSTALSLPVHLRHLLWFELKIDMSIENVVLQSLPSIQVELFDVYLRNLDDMCVPQITGILTKMHKRYSGIHLDNTTLSPESIYTLLKELKQRGIMLCATAKAIDKYRRWYYPLLSELPTKKLLSDKEVKSILGFEDRKFYSDHKIQSSTFVKSIDAWNLTSYLEELKEIKYFVYQADNLSFVKNLEGEVETNHHGDSSVKVDTTGNIL